ncbi:MAG: type II toxin-antitoxin system YhaV family toxin [Alphaproteobacteria bacterium]|nr:MAG: type II toxin-antitoxin system YhaV family toxin [Alphaproteobacteria bacterium]
MATRPPSKRGHGPKAVIVNGWRLYAHPLFLDQLEALRTEVERCKRRNPTTWRQKDAAKRLAAIYKLIWEVIPADPDSPKFRLGKTLGSAYGHWRRAKFFKRYRLFFRYSSEHRVIVFVWVNDRTSLRATGSKRDVYAVFKNMLARGHPPDDFPSLVAEAEGTGGGLTEATTKRRP